MLFPVDPTIFEQPQLSSTTLVLFALAFLAVAIAASFRPVFACVGVIVADPFEYARFANGFKVSYPGVVIAGAVLGIAIYYARTPAVRHTLRDLSDARLLITALAALLAATALSWLQADYHFLTRDELIKLSGYILIFFVALAAGRASDDLGAIENATGIVLLVVAFLAIIEEWVGAPSVVDMGGALIPRVAGPLEGPNQLAGYLQVMFPMVAALALFRTPKPFQLIALFLAAAADVLTFSRNGLLCGTVAFAIVVVLARGRWLPVVGAVVLGAGFAALLRPEAFARFSSLEQNQNAGRVGTRAILWSAAAQLWRAHPWLGIGAGNFELEISRVGPPDVRTHANDWYIQSLVEGGIPLFTATLFTVYASIASFVDGLRRDPIVLAAFAVSIGLALGSILDYALFYPKIADMWWLLLGLASGRRILLHREPARTLPLVA